MLLCCKKFLGKQKQYQIVHNERNISNRSLFNLTF